jgi:A/G-specific adenine glycosylase
MAVENKKKFTNQLIRWNQESNNRLMPWKGEKDPYRIWLSEIILQQTRVEQGWEYYKAFVKFFPTVFDLAKASETRVFKLWEGLGYYTRCKNLMVTAKMIALEKKGIFPDTYAGILALKGIGPYTAAAIASFAYNLPYAVVDGNVFRVLSRYFGINKAVDTQEGIKIFNALASELLDTKQPGIYNQAIMDFGAVVCKPKLPLCAGCPLKKTCVAQINGLTGLLPVKEKQMIKKTRWFYYFLVEQDNKIAVRKRGPKDIWENLYEFVLVETIREMDTQKLLLQKNVIQLLPDNRYAPGAVSKKYKQQLTHQTIEGKFIKMNISGGLPIKGYEMVSVKKIRSLPFPKFINSYLDDQPPVK